MAGQPFNAKQIGRAVQLLRERAGLSQQTLAEMVGLSIRTISRIENGTYETSLRRFFDIAQALGTTLDHIVSGRAVSVAERGAKYEPRSTAVIDASGLEPRVRQALQRLIATLPRKD